MVKPFGGWVKIWIPHHLRHAIRKSGVPCDGMLQTGTIWTAEWVANALKVYQDNDGYAGMDLTEFLHKMNPGK